MDAVGATVEQLLARARALIVEPLGARRYRVTGGRAPHLVATAADRAATCDCVYYRVGSRTCKHILAVWVHEETLGARRRKDPQAGLLEGMSDDALLEALGPSWSQMTEDQREAYGSRGGGRSSESLGGTLQAAIERDTEALLARLDCRLERVATPAPGSSPIMRKYREARDRIAAERQRS